MPNSNYDKESCGGLQGVNTSKLVLPQECQVTAMHGADQDYWMVTGQPQWRTPKNIPKYASTARQPPLILLQSHLIFHQTGKDCVTFSLDSIEEQIQTDCSQLCYIIFGSLLVKDNENPWVGQGLNQFDSPIWHSIKNGKCRGIFMSNMLTCLCVHMGMKHLWTSIYRPQTGRQVDKI